MARVTIKFAGDEITTSKYGSTSEIISDRNLSSQLGFDASRVDTYVNGSKNEGSLYDGDVVELLTKANTKG